MNDLTNTAKEILKNNDRNGITIPSASLYPHMWAWDSVFAAMGWAHIDIVRAENEISAQLEAMRDNGMIPHIVFNPETTDDYFPGPKAWGNQFGSLITQPPIWAIGLEYLLDKGLNSRKIPEYLKKIEKVHLFFKSERDPENLNLVAIAHPWESGMDNSPAWDEPLTQVSTETNIKLARLDNKKVSDPKQRPSDAEYRKYLRIVQSLKENQLKPTEFYVYDPFMSSVLYQSELSLQRMCKRLNIPSKAYERAEAIKRALLKCFDEKTGRFLYRDALSQKDYLSPTLGSLSGLFLKDLPAGIKAKSEETLIRDHMTEFGLSTYAKNHPNMDPNCYWRGPVWINTNFLFHYFSNVDLRNKTLGLLSQSGFREYFSPEDGSGLGSFDFSWSAALYMVLSKS